MNEREKYEYQVTSAIPYHREAVKRFRFLVGVLFVIGATLLSVVSLLTGVVIGAAREQQTTRPGKTLLFVEGENYDAPLKNGDDTLTVAGVANKVEAGVVEVLCQSASDEILSGIVVHSDGLILTAYTPVADAHSVSVRLPEEEDVVEARLFAGDEVSDIAILEIERSGMQAIEFGNSDLLIAGQDVVAMGIPYRGSAVTVSSGEISAEEHDLPDGTEVYPCLNTNAFAGLNGYGGGLFNMCGELVGIMRARSASESVPFTVIFPVNRVKLLLGDLINRGYIPGRVDCDVVRLREYEETGMLEAGVYVSELVRNDGSNPFRVGDAILEVDGTAVENVKTWTRILNRHAVGESVVVKVKRGLQTLELVWTLEEKKRT